LSFFVYAVTDFSAAVKARAVKFCMRVGLLSGQVNIGSRGVTGAALFDGMYAATDATLRGLMVGGSVGIGNCGRRRCLRPYGEVCVLQAC